MGAEELRLRVDAALASTVSASWHRGEHDDGAAVLLAPGAGGDKDGEGLTALAEGLAAAGLDVVRANLPYREAGRPLPPRADRTVPDYAAVLGAAAEATGHRGPWVVGGKSYGGRVASLLAAGRGGGVEPPVAIAALLFYGYPLHPPGKRDRLRVEHWPDVAVPCRFLQGARDQFCDLGLLRRHLPDLGAAAELVVVDGGDHSLRVVGKHASDGEPRRPAIVLAEMAPACADWIRAVAPGAE